jgi:hypothetical protein
VGFAIACSAVQSPENDSPQQQKSKLALAIAKGTSVTIWAKNNNVPKRTAYRWATDPEVRAKVERTRRRALDRAIGHLSDSVNRAAHGITKLADTAASESVRLSAYRTVFSNMIAASEFAELQDRITQLEEQLHERERAVGTGQAG